MKPESTSQLPKQLYPPNSALKNTGLVDELVKQTRNTEFLRITKPSRLTHCVYKKVAPINSSYRPRNLYTLHTKMDPSNSSNHPVPRPSTSTGTGTGTGTGSSGQNIFKLCNSSCFSDRDNNAGIQDEQVLALVFRSMNFDPHVVSVAACVSRRLRAVAKRVLWRELCISRAPRMVTDLSCGAPAAASRSSIGGGWHAIAKLLFFCCGCGGGGGRQIEGHFVPVSRFSRTSGRSFLQRRCHGDLLYVSDPCEHPVAGEEEDLGVYRGVFGGFMRSKTRARLISRQAQLESRVRCPYCGARVWSMTAAKMVPRSASRRLGSHEGSLEYFVCVNGHLHGSCWLAHLSDDEDGEDE